MMEIKKTAVAKKLIPVIILIFILGCASSKPDIAEISSGGDEVRIYEIYGMNCPGCHGGIEKLINKIPGVAASKANWEEQRLQIVLNSNADINDSDIIGAIERANFTPGKRLQ